ncbi:Tuftelin-interacting protein 11 [Trachymyrmex zeteki]|uniref:Tuftelin-interacting protein 11 n=1 Tax=Mycetomoellerius zeteki TaxID=64791 RepID=A0A151WZQ0_9HYME|nr:Tuftelin-interacting protein 11 [Trachymyrmex zeteki]
MSADEVESFEVTDYDLDNEFNFACPRRKLSKKQQMLESKESNKGPKNYTAPVNFFAGIQQAGQPKEKEAKDDEEDEEETRDSQTKHSSSRRVPNRRVFMLTFNRLRETGSFSIRQENNRFQAALRRDLQAGNRILQHFDNHPETSVRNAWEVHTKGMVAKLLLQREMGFEPGKDLGKQLQGISAPVEAHLRKGRGAIGAYGPEKIPKILEKKKDDDGEEIKESKSKVSQWRKGDSNKKKVRYCYRSVNQVLEDGKLKPNKKLPVSSDMRNRLDTLIYPIIRRKLGSALGGWHPSDRAARLMLQPWTEVFAKGDMEAFLVKNIIPKLQIALSEFVINPHQQHLDQWNWVYEWKELIPVHIMAGLLDKFFFLKWLQVLALWLNHSPNYDQHFKKALDMMNRAVSGPQTHQPGAMEQVSYLTSLERTQPTRLAEAVRTASQILQGFKDFVQKKCEERGILFMPIPNRYKEAKQVYKVGNVQVYINSNVLFVCHNGTNWMPTHLNALLDMSEL